SLAASRRRACPSSTLVFDSRLNATGGFGYTFRILPGLRPRRIMPRILSALLLLTLAPLATADDKINFDRDVLPLLSDKCFQCHGREEKARKAKLRLDRKEDAFASGGIVAGKGADSELVKRITSTDPAEMMPPPKANKKLTPAQIANLKKWVDQGAE